MSFVQRVNQVISDKHLLRRGDRLVVAVSGGPDSICLLRVLDELAEHWSWSLVVAHLDHGFRGAAAAADAKFVRGLAQQLGWPASVSRVDMPAVLHEAGGSAQDKSREQRYRFLWRVAAEHRAQAIVLAHHQGDQAETVLLHLLRGAGLSGLAGMRWREEQAPCPLVRPLLQESRADILDYLRSLGQGFRVDASNADNHYQRNYLRLEVLPALTTVNSDVQATLARTADLLQAENDLLEELAVAAYGQIKSGRCPGALSLSVQGLGEQPLALRRRVLRTAWQELSGTERDLEYSHVEAALALLDQGVGSSCNWPKGFSCRRDYEQLCVSSPDFAETGFALALPVPGTVQLPMGLGSIEAQILPASSLPKSLAGSLTRVYCDLGACQDQELLVRSWLPGDEFQPFGMRGRKKLQDFFIDAKVDRHRRLQIPLVVSQGEIVWVAGYRLAEPFRVTPCSSRVVCLEYRHA